MGVQGTGKKNEQKKERRKSILRLPSVTPNGVVPGVIKEDQKNRERVPTRV